MTGPFSGGFFSSHALFAHLGHIFPEPDGGGVATNIELREDGGIELREDGGIELRE